MELSRQKVVLGLSGGVDSAVCAHLLKEKGYDVTGVFLELGDSADAKAVADGAGIGFMSVPIEDELEKHVKAPFCDAYLSGKTPNPCIICNPTVKFRALFDIADKIGAYYVSTGHYARIETRDGEARLITASSDKDQTYMLHRLPKEWLSRLVFPLGELSSKDEVREIARKYDISVASKPDSMEICFIPDNDYASFVERRGIIPPCGDFVTEDGEILGTHRGIHRYTVGMRRHLGISAGKRIYVKSIDREKNQVILADGDDVYVKNITVSNINMQVEKFPKLPFSCKAKVRYSRQFATCTILSVEGDTLVASFDPPVRAPAPGQSAVFYDGDAVLCGGFIE